MSGKIVSSIMFAGAAANCPRDVLKDCWG